MAKAAKSKETLVNTGESGKIARFAYAAGEADSAVTELGSLAGRLRRHRTR